MLTCDCGQWPGEFPIKIVIQVTPGLERVGKNEVKIDGPARQTKVLPSTPLWTLRAHVSTLPQSCRAHVEWNRRTGCPVRPNQCCNMTRRTGSRNRNLKFLVGLLALGFLCARRAFAIMCTSADLKRPVERGLGEPHVPINTCSVLLLSCRLCRTVM